MRFFRTDSIESTQIRERFSFLWDILSSKKQFNENTFSICVYKTAK